MKLKKVVSLCMKAGLFTLMDKVDSTGEITQWLGDGAAFYPLNGLPILDEETMRATFDIPFAKLDKIKLSRRSVPEGLDLEDFCDNDRALEDSYISINYGGETVKPFLFREGIVYIQRKYLSPVDDDVTTYYLRHTPSGLRYVVVKVGLLISAIIMPYEAETEGFVGRLGEVLCLTEAEMERRKRGYTRDMDFGEPTPAEVIDGMEAGDDPGEDQITFDDDDREDGGDGEA